MASVVDIANLALLRVGSEPIISLTDANVRARACNTAWPFVRKTVLRECSWNVATVRAQLAPLSTAPAFEFTKQYSLPADCLHLMEVDTSREWRVENGKILTMESSTTDGLLNIRYIKDETDTELYDSQLAQVMSTYLACMIVEKLTNNKGKKELLLNEYIQELARAMASDGQESSPSEFEEDDWILARF